MQSFMCLQLVVHKLQNLIGWAFYYIVEIMSNNIPLF